MKQVIILSVLAVIMFGCGTQNKKAQETAEIVVLTVDQLYENAGDLADKEVVVKGMVMHVCKEGGARCFLMGSTEDINIRVEAGEKIGAFNQEQMGSELEIAGILRIVRTEADAHNPGKEHGVEGENQEQVVEGEGHDHDSIVESAHEIIAESQENAEVIYFIDGLSVKEIPVEPAK